MAQIIMLGTGAALSDANRENTFLVVKGEKEAILVDCAGSPTQRLLKAGVPLRQLNHIILTHHHPDHLYGLSVLLLDLWLDGRKKTLHLYGLSETLRAARGMMRAFEWERWLEHGFFPVEYHRVPPEGVCWEFLTSEFTVAAAPTKHLLPTIAVRFWSTVSGQSVTYSSDTMLHPGIVKLAEDSDVLIHEATSVTKPPFGHSSARQAGQQARRAGVRKLVLVHLPPNTDPAAMKAAAAAEYKGPIVVAKDFQKIEF